MIERIKELAAQAGIQELPIEDNDPDYCGKIEDLERFVGLIVRECAEVSVLDDSNYSAQYKILKHFGIK